jgi:hypothetical protein
MAARIDSNPPTIEYGPFSTASASSCSGLSEKRPLSGSYSTYPAAEVADSHSRT